MEGHDNGYENLKRRFNEEAKRCGAHMGAHKAMLMAIDGTSMEDLKRQKTCNYVELHESLAQSR